MPPTWSGSPGRQHQAVYDLIAHAGMTGPADIYAAARLAPPAASWPFPPWPRLGLIARLGRTVVVGAVRLDDIAAAHHLDETFSERIARFRNERAAWHDWLALQDQMRGLALPDGRVLVIEVGTVRARFWRRAGVPGRRSGARPPDHGF